MFLTRKEMLTLSQVLAYKIEKMERDADRAYQKRGASASLDKKGEEILELVRLKSIFDLELMALEKVGA